MSPYSKVMVVVKALGLTRACKWAPENVIRLAVEVNASGAVAFSES